MIEFFFVCFIYVTSNVFILCVHYTLVFDVGSSAREGPDQCKYDDRV